MKTIEELTSEHVAWYATNDEEVWSDGPFDTKEEADAVARSSELYLIGLAGKRAIRVSELFDAGGFLEAAEESLYELCNEDGDPLLEFSAEAEADLTRRVRQVIDEWQVAHQLSPQPWRFSWCDETPSQWSIEEKERAKGGAA